MNNNSLKESAKKLRLKGLTYTEINERLGTSYPKSTMSGWCKDLRLPDKSKERLLKLSRNRLRLHRTKALVANKLILEKRQADATDKALSVLAGISENKEALKLALAMLHWGEGAKSKSYRGLSIGNSDARLLRVYMDLLELCYGIRRNNFKARILCRADQNQEILKLYWSIQLDINLSNFYRTYVDKRTAGKQTTKKYMGVCVLSCAGTDIQLEMEQIANNFLTKRNAILITDEKNF